MTHRMRRLGDSFDTPSEAVGWQRCQRCQSASHQLQCLNPEDDRQGAWTMLHGLDFSVRLSLPRQVQLPSVVTAVNTVHVS